MSSLLTSKQKWQLAFRLLIFYSPVLFYVNLPESVRKGDISLIAIIIIVIFSLLTLGMYYVWVTLTDLIQYRIALWFGQDFLMKFSWLALLLSFAISLTLAIGYIFVFQQVLELVFSFIVKVWPWLPKNKPVPFPTEVFPYLERFNKGFSVVIMFSAFYLIINIRAYQQLTDVQVKAEQLEKEAILAQFAALKSQVNPHFLFNSLSILTSLVHEDADLSEQFVQQLSKAYRYILEQRDQDLVLLKTELDFIEAYTFLLKIRFENKFQVNIDVPQAIKNRSQITPLALQMLVENVVKHNRMSVNKSLWVNIYCQGEFLVVENPLQPRDQKEISTGVGLNNIINRYALLTTTKITHGIIHNSYIVKIPLL